MLISTDKLTNKSDDVVKLLKSLEKNKSVTNLTLNDFENESLIDFQNLMKNNQKLTQLKLNSGKLNSKGLKYIFESINENESITHLDLSKPVGLLTYDETEKIETDNSFMIKSLSKNKMLKYLDLSNCSNVLDPLSEVLKYNKTIETLIVKEMDSDVEVLKKFLQSLKENNSLTSLSITISSISKESFYDFFQDKNCTLKELTIDYIGQKLQKFIDLLYFLSKNQTIQIINFEQIFFLAEAKTTSYFEEIFKFISFSKTLKKVRITKSDFKEIIVVKPTAMVHKKNGVPYLLDVNNLEKPFSISHHGRFATWVSLK